MLLNPLTTLAAGRCRCSSSLLVVESSSSSGDLPVALRVVVVGVDDDLAGERLDRHVAVGPQRDGHHHQVARLGRLGRRRGSGPRPQLVDQFLEGLRPARVAQHHVVPGGDGQPGHGAADMSAADQSNCCHISPAPSACRPLSSRGRERSDVTGRTVVRKTAIRAPNIARAARAPAPGLDSRRKLGGPRRPARRRGPRGRAAPSAGPHRLATPARTACSTRCTDHRLRGCGSHPAHAGERGGNARSGRSTPAAGGGSPNPPEEAVVQLWSYAHPQVPIPTSPPARATDPWSVRPLPTLGKGRFPHGKR